MECFRDALAAARRVDAPEQQVFCLDALGHVSRLRGRYSDALSFHTQSLELNRQRGSKRHVAFDLLHIGLSELYLGRWDDAQDKLERARRHFIELGDSRGQVPVLIALCRVERRRGEFLAAQEHAERALGLADEAGYRRAVILAREELGDLAAEAGERDDAIGILTAALDDARDMAPEGDLVYELCWRLARLHAEEDPERAERLADRGIELAAASEDRRELGSGYVALAIVRARQKRHADAAELLERGFAQFEEIEAPFELAEAHEVAARIARDQLPTDPAPVIEHLLVARRLYSRLGAAHSLERVDAELEQAESGGGAPKRPSRRAGDVTLIARDESMCRLVETARELAAFDSTVLVEGETGSGKELISRILHDAGPRASEPFVALNCAAFPESLLESELFGHRRGAFTGADRDRQGRLLSAGKGTVLLDEIDKASRDFQAKLLRVIEERRVVPVGATEAVNLEARVVCATNRDLRAQANEGAFLPDLYYRLAALRLRIPPLRERPDDLEALIRHAVDGCAGRFGADRYVISREAMRALSVYSWPGNVRELRNVVEAAAFFARQTGRILPEHLPPEVLAAAEDAGGVTLPARIEELERKEIALAMRRARGNKTEAARILGVSRKGLLDRLRRLGLE